MQNVQNRLHDVYPCRVHNRTLPLTFPPDNYLQTFLRPFSKTHDIHRCYTTCRIVVVVVVVVVAGYLYGAMKTRYSALEVCAI